MIRETRKKKCNSPSEFFEVRMLKKCYSLATRIYRKMPHNRFFILIRAAVIYHVYNRFFNLLGQKKKAEIVEVKGMKMVYNAYFPRWIFFFNQWKIKDHEEPAFSLFDSLVRGGMTVLDIGASTGFFTLKACRTPVIAYDIPVVNDLVINGNNGYLVYPRDINQLSKRIVRILLNPALKEKLGKQGRELVEKRYTWKQATDRILSIICRLVFRS